MNFSPTIPLEIANTLRQMQAKIDRLEAASLGALVDARGRRFSNAGDGVSPTDLATVRQVKSALAQAAAAATTTRDDLTVKSLHVKTRARIDGELDLSFIEDAAILFTRADGVVDGDEAELSWRYSNNSLLLGQDVKLRWRHGIWIEQSTNPGVAVVFIISGEDDNTTTPLSRVALGQDTAGHPALVPNGANLEIRDAGGGALSEVSAKKFNPLSPQTYTVTNVTTDRSYDANATTLDEIADALGTLIADLRAAGLVL